MRAVRFPPIPALVRQELVEVLRQEEGGFSEPVAVPRCRVDRAGQLSPNDWQLTAGCTARVLVDATEYAGELVEGDLVRFGGEDHAVAKASRIDNPDGTPHHWELEVT